MKTHSGSVDCTRRLGVAAGAVFLAIMSMPAAGDHSPGAPTPVVVAPESADIRAQALVAQMTRAEKIAMVTGQLGLTLGPYKASPAALGGDGFAPGVARLGIPDLQLIGAGLGVTIGRRANGQSTALPSTLALSSSFDRDLAYAAGTVIGRETRQHGFNVSLGGGVNLTRDPRGGRAFEYHGEDPVLAGKMLAPQLQAIQAQGVVATIKHYAFNDQETGRHGVNAIIDERAMREAELLAFEIAIRESDVGAVMCAYNRINGGYACESDYLLNQVLKGQWGFRGWVMSDWGARHGTGSGANGGLDQSFFDGTRFGAALEGAILSGEVPERRLDDMVRRILRSLLTVGAVGEPRAIEPIDVAAGGEVARQIATSGAVLLKNDGILPLRFPAARRVAVIGLHADLGVMSGGGSSQVIPVGGNAIVPETLPAGLLGYSKVPVWAPSPPLAALRTRLPRANVRYDDGTNPSRAAKLAKWADVAVVFAGQRRTEGADVPDLGLGAGQDELIAAVAAANPRTVVVLQTGGAVLMPWLDRVGAVLEAWYPGQRGGEAIADLLSGVANPSGKLPLTFPASEQDLPRVRVLGPASDSAGLEHFFNPKLFDVDYSEGALVGYKWFDARARQPLFPFGHGLSYTTFAYSNPTCTAGDTVRVAFDLANTGPVAGVEVAQVYVGLPESAAAPPRRLAGWARVPLQPGEVRRVEVQLEPRALAVWNVAEARWVMPSGAYAVSIGASSRDLRLSQQFERRESSPIP